MAQSTYSTSPVTAPRILQLTAINSACEQWRVWWPSIALRKLGYTCDYLPFENFREIFPDVQAGKYDVIVTPRYTWTTISVKTEDKRKDVWTGDLWRKQIAQYNLTWVYETDDDLFSEISVSRILEFYRYAPKKVQKMWRERLSRYREDRIRLSQYVHGFTVSTDHLRDVVSQYTNAPIYVIPNAVDMPSWNSMVDGKKRTISPVTIGWAGGIRDESDLKSLADAWHVVAELCPEVKFIVFGQQSETLIASVPRKRLIKIEWCELEDFPAQLLNFDIGCCALEDIEWNKSRSCNKWYEYSLVKAASVVSPTAYGKEVTNGVNALIATNTEEWIRWLVRLVREPELRSSLANNAYETILKEHTLDQHAWRWMDAWTKIVGQSRTQRIHAGSITV